VAIREIVVSVQVGDRDFALDLLFFHRSVNCVIAIELKVGRFEPEYRCFILRRGAANRWISTT
jgi:hypothetical protein